MKQRELAKKLNVSELKVLRMIKGYTRIHIDIAEKLTDLLGMNPVWWQKASPAEKKAALKAAALTPAPGSCPGHAFAPNGGREAVEGQP